MTKLISLFTGFNLALPISVETSPREVNFNRKGLMIFLLVLLVISLGAWYFYYNQGLTLSYNDARSHLNVARRVIDSLQPGAAQIGSVWLPLFHILELPFIGNDWLWHTGLAGSIVSMVSFVFGGLFVLGISKKLHFDRIATAIALIVYALNPNFLFLQTTPMTEALLIALSLGTAYFALAWVQTDNLVSLVACAAMTFLASLTRYDGWFLAAYVFVIFGLVSWRKKGFKFAEGNLVLYATLAGFGVLLWILWNWMIFKDPLYFVLGPYSAKAQQDVLSLQGRLLTKGDLIYSFFVYLFSVVYNLGTWITLVVGLGWILLVKKSSKYKWEEKLALSILLSPFLFNVLSLFVGHSVLYLPNFPPYTWFNVRYGLMMLPAAAIALGLLINGKRLLKVLVILIIAAQFIVMYLGNSIIAIEDGVRGSSGEYLDVAGNWLSDNAKSGLILVAASSNDALLFRSGLPLKRFIVEGASKYWQKALADPRPLADWVVMHKNDITDKNLRSNPHFINFYDLVYHDDFTYIYRRNLQKTGHLDVYQLP